MKKHDLIQTFFNIVTLFKKPIQKHQLKFLIL